MEERDCKKYLRAGNILGLGLIITFAVIFLYIVATTTPAALILIVAIAAFGYCLIKGGGPDGGMTG